MFSSVSFSFSIQHEISEDSFIQVVQSDRSISEVKVWVSCECPMVNWTLLVELNIMYTFGS